MNLSEKIEEIRSKPEHIRMRYVWGCVAISMFIILGIWIFSVASMFGEEKNNSIQDVGGGFADIQQKFQQFKDQAPSLKSLSNQPLDSGTEGVADTTQNSSGFQYPAGGVSPDSNAPQSGIYSDMPNTNSQ